VRRHERKAIAFAKDSQLIRKAHGQEGNVAVEEFHGAFTVTQGFGVNVHGETRFVVGEPAIVADFADGKFGGQGGGRGFGDARQGSGGQTAARRKR